MRATQIYDYNANFLDGNYNAFYMDLAADFEKWLNDATYYGPTVFYKIFILKYPIGMQYPTSTDRISSFINELKIFYKSRGRYPKLEWVRGCSPSGQYYHLLFQVDVKTDPQRVNLLKKATGIWQEKLGIKDQGLVHLITTAGERLSSTDSKLPEDEESFPSYFIKIIRVARHYAECNDKEKLPVDVLRY